MIYRPGDPFYAVFTTQRFDTGAAADADTLPVATAIRNGAEDETFVLTVAKAATGLYVITGTVPAYSAGDKLHVLVAATVNAVSGKAVVGQSMIDTKLRSELAAAIATRAAPGDAMALGPTESAELAETVSTAVVDAIAASQSGLYAVTINTVNELDEPIGNVQIAILNQAGQGVRTLITNSNGTVSTTLDAGTFTARSFKSRVNFDDTSFTITAAATVEIEGIELSPLQPAAGLQTIWFVPDNPSLLLDTNVVIKAERVAVNQELGDSLITSSPAYATRADGHYALALAKGGTFQITGTVRDIVFLKKRITVTTDDIRSMNEYI